MWLDGFVSSLLACDQAHFCEFGVKFGGGATSAQGKRLFLVIFSLFLARTAEIFLKLSQMTRVSLLTDGPRRLFLFLRCRLKKQMKHISV